MAESLDTIDMLLRAATNRRQASRGALRRTMASGQRMLLMEQINVQNGEIEALLDRRISWTVEHLSAPDDLAELDVEVQ